MWLLAAPVLQHQLEQGLCLVLIQGTSHKLVQHRRHLQDEAAAAAVRTSSSGSSSDSSKQSKQEQAQRHTHKVQCWCSTHCDKLLLLLCKLLVWHGCCSKEHSDFTASDSM